MRKPDLIAGISVAGLLLPEAVAYAGIAGLPPQRAILAAIAGCLAYAALGRSRFAIVAPTSSSAAILAAAIGSMAEDPVARAALTTLVVAIVGITFLIAAAARLGGLAGFISRPVLRGFAFGLAVTIILRQMPVLARLDLAPSDIFYLVAGLIGHAAQWHRPSVVVGALALFALLLLRRIPPLPGVLVVLAAGIAASRLLDLPAQGVVTVGAINLVPAWPVLPDLSRSGVMRLVELTLPLVLILFAESWGTMRAMALRHGDILEPNRELAALGAANLVAAALQGMPVGAGFSAGSAAETAGATSRLTAVCAAIGLALLVLFGADLVASLPQPVLAAVVIGALTHSLDPAPLIRLVHLRRDQVIMVCAVLGVLGFGVLNGMIFAIVLSLAALIHRMSAPQLTRLGRLGQSHDYVDIARHPDAVPPVGLAIWRPAEPLFFGNAERIMSLVAARQAAEPTVRVVILSLEESADLDSTALEALLEFDATLQARGVRLRLARTRDAIRDLLAAADARDLLTRIDFSVDDAVMAAGKS